MRAGAGDRAAAGAGHGDEIVLLGGAAEIGEWKHDHRKTGTTNALRYQAMSPSC